MKRGGAIKTQELNLIQLVLKIGLTRLWWELSKDDLEWTWISCKWTWTHCHNSDVIRINPFIAFGARTGPDRFGQLWTGLDRWEHVWTGIRGLVRIKIRSRQESSVYQSDNSLWQSWRSFFRTSDPERSFQTEVIWQNWIQVIWGHLTVRQPERSKNAIRNS